MSEHGELLSEQRAFYDADADGYDAWLSSLTADDNHAPEAVAFRQRLRSVAEMLARLQPAGRILELAAGTGLLSSLVLPYADRLVLLDSSTRSLDIARHRFAAHADRIDYVVADIFDWDPGPSRYDVVCFAAWLHHVPRDCFDAFWAQVDRALAPGGIVVFEFGDRRTRPGDGLAVPPEPSHDYAMYHDAARGLSIRDRLGRRWTVVHELWDPEDLLDRLRRLGWDATLELTDDAASQWATARRRGDVGCH